MNRTPASVVEKKKKKRLRLIKGDQSAVSIAGFGDPALSKETLGGVEALDPLGRRVGRASFHLRRLPIGAEDSSP